MSSLLIGAQCAAQPVYHNSPQEHTSASAENVPQFAQIEPDEALLLRQLAQRDETIRHQAQAINRVTTVNNNLRERIGVLEESQGEQRDRLAELTTQNINMGREVQRYTVANVQPVAVEEVPIAAGEVQERELSFLQNIQANVRPVIQQCRPHLRPIQATILLSAGILGFFFVPYACAIGTIATAATLFFSWILN